MTLLQITSDLWRDMTIDQRIAAIRYERNKCCSVMQIARKYGTTKGSIVGLMHRNRDTFPAFEDRAWRKRPHKPKAKAKAAKRAPVTDADAPKPEEPILVPALVTAPKSTTAASAIRTTFEIALKPIEAMTEFEQQSDGDCAEGGVTMAGLRPDSCRWPLWSDTERYSADSRYCGHSVSGNGPYCGDHAALSYYRPSDRDDRSFFRHAIRLSRGR